MDLWLFVVIKAIYLWVLNCFQTKQGIWRWQLDIFHFILTLDKPINKLTEKIIKIINHQFCAHTANQFPVGIIKIKLNV